MTSDSEYDRQVTKMRRAKLMRDLPAAERNQLIRDGENVIDGRPLFDDARKGAFVR